MLAAAKCEALPAQSENREKSPKIAKIVCAGGASNFRSGQHWKYKFFLINFKIKIDHVPVVLKQKFFSDSKSSHRVL